MTNAAASQGQRDFPSSGSHDSHDEGDAVLLADSLSDEHENKVNIVIIIIIIVIIMVIISMSLL